MGYEGHFASRGYLSIADKGNGLDTPLLRQYFLTGISTSHILIKARMAFHTSLYISSAP
jgi:hypothetical protein